MFVTSLVDCATRLKDIQRVTAQFSKCSYGVHFRITDTKSFSSHIEETTRLREPHPKWRLWVAVDAEFDVRPNSDTATSSPEFIRTGNESGNREVTLPSQVAMNPIIRTVLLLMRQNLVAAVEATGEQDEGGSHIKAGEEVGVELLFWDTVVSLKVSTADCATT